MKVVDQVYPEFAEQVTMVDVDINDKCQRPAHAEAGTALHPNDRSV